MRVITRKVRRFIAYGDALAPAVGGSGLGGVGSELHSVGCQKYVLIVGIVPSVPFAVTLTTL